MNKLYAGFSRVNITPMMGIELAGYYKTRRVEDVLDELEIPKGWKLVLSTCRTNGKQGYFPMQVAYDEGGYEA